ncbi:hypothetical protein [Microvirga terricola]|uniref:Uncharacterized protein n=1 Tax=Microvirga terricola TaxID=2719797 RepID=A0ABX0VB72_9HYPH|nr:hypothetical protein [Microvirga terricola]NIX76743.1 hypothetical protein [Microvirga terricola]
MLAATIKALAAIIIYAAVSGFAAWNGAEILGRLGLFGSGHESGKELGIIFVGFPALWFVLFMLLFAVRGWPLVGFLEGWRGFAFAILAFLVICVAFYAWILSRP